MRPAYRCPLCRLLLMPDGRSFACGNRHRFDLAREGYVNLLPVQKKSSREPGDSAEMIQARRRFLAAGHYAPLRDAIIAAVAGLNLSPQAALLDLGCGEGWYAAGLAEALPLAIDGIDISKAAIKIAARAYPGCRFAVAGNYDLPFGDASFAAALNVFAPLEAGELSRVLAPGGYLLRVSAAPEHLFALKALLYAQPRLHEHEIPALPGFEGLQQQRLQAEIELNQTRSLHDLIQMTPYAWKLQGQPDLGASLPFRVGIDAWLSLYRKH